jgi:FkbM family methyltransferase
MLQLDDKDSLNLKNEPYEPVEVALIKYLLKPDDVALDIGAHIGYYTVMMAKLCKKVYAFEAEPYNYFVLRHNLIPDKLYPKVTAVMAAVSNQKGSIPFFLCLENSGMHRIYPSKWCIEKPMTIQSVMLDDFINTKIDFVKMDIEGSEFGALKGMKNILETSKPTMIMEFHPPSIEEYGASPEEEYHFLKTLGYSIRLIPKISIPISFQDLEKETRKESGRNLLCLPSGRSL